MNVLVVDDDIDTVSLLSMLLERHGCRVDMASTLADARAALSQGGYDVLISDLHLPDGTGTSLLRPARPEGLRVAILVTGAGGLEQRRMSQEAGFDRFYSKPIDGSQIIAKIRSLADEPRS